MEMLIIKIRDRIYIVKLNVVENWARSMPSVAVE